jgi:hypothetical protein
LDFEAFKVNTLTPEISVPESELKEACLSSALPGPDWMAGLADLANVVSNSAHLAGKISHHNLTGYLTT